MLCHLSLLWARRDLFYIPYILLGIVFVLLHVPTYELLFWVQCSSLQRTCLCCKFQKQKCFWLHSEMTHCTGSAILQSLSTDAQVFSEAAKFCIHWIIFWFLTLSISSGRLTEKVGTAQLGEVKVSWRPCRSLLVSEEGLWRSWRGTLDQDL